MSETLAGEIPPIAHALPIEMVEFNGIPTRLRSMESVWSYDTTDPYAINLLFIENGREGPMWTFSRHLANTGINLEDEVGIGDVRFFPVKSDTYIGMRMFTNNGASAGFLVPKIRLRTFLEETYAAVPFGEAEANLAAPAVEQVIACTTAVADWRRSNGYDINLRGRDGALYRHNHWPFPGRGWLKHLSSVGSQKEN